MKTKTPKGVHEYTTTCVRVPRRFFAKSLSFIAGVQLLFGIYANVQCRGKGVASAQRVLLARTHDQRLQDLLTEFGWKWRSLHALQSCARPKWCDQNNRPALIARASPWLRRLYGRFRRSSLNTPNVTARANDFTYQFQFMPLRPVILVQIQSNCHFSTYIIWVRYGTIDWLEML